MSTDTDAPRELTRDEVRQRFLDAVRGIANYWKRVSEQTPEERIDGAVFSLLVLLDGCHGDMPGFVLAPSPHPDDKEYHRMEGSNWFPENDEDEVVNCDIGGGLHEEFFPATKGATGP